jgi:segregation and condensation protein A
VERATFRSLTADCAGTYEIVARFLAVLELYREQAVSLEQLEPLGELYITWTGAEDGEVVVGDDYSGRPVETKNDD